MKLPVKKLHPMAKLPSFAHHDDAGMDLFCVENEAIPAGAQVTVSTGIALHIPDDHVGLIWDKSGVSSKKNLKVMGGVYDAGYRGEITVTLINLGSEEQHFKAGEKVAQMLIQRVEHPNIIEVDELEDSVRGAGRYGSTGV